ncbi:DUF1772 domain-containing protein [Nocardioides sp. CFH 31398]|uniref:DUF1772 domain-containing protein n=1 Tax=Nocardioides sp. CFH 31398 TaxID=2919579 RepID=UPI001F06A1CE|nr:DUF1772 domain-containing protein [Nocardioides sp. CFH 31398]MCH1867351.1 DUF1772 domain-containing protein [Nocardioides sp. CFH 31398]
MVLAAVRALALLLVGVYAGGVVFSALAPSVYRLPGSAYVRLWQAQNHDYGATMPVLLLAGLAALVLTAALSRSSGALVLGPTALAAVLLVATIVLTVTQLEPFNRAADGWNPDRLPADWSSTLDAWRRLHTVRIVLAVAAFSLLLAAQVADTRPGPRERTGSEAAVAASH